MPNYIERATLHPRGFNDSVALPYGLRVGEVKAAMDDIYDLLYNVNQFLAQRGWDRLEDMLLAAAFSGMMSGLVVGVCRSRAAHLQRTSITMAVRTSFLGATTTMTHVTTAKKASR